MNLVLLGVHPAISLSDVTLWQVSDLLLITIVNEQFTSQSKPKEIEVTLV